MSGQVVADREVPVLCRVFIEVCPTHQRSGDSRKVLSLRDPSCPPEEEVESPTFRRVRRRCTRPPRPRDPSDPVWSREAWLVCESRDEWSFHFGGLGGVWVSSRRGSETSSVWIEKWLPRRRRRTEGPSRMRSHRSGSEVGER